MTLDEQIKQAAARGMTHLSLYPVPSADRRTTYWQASATPSTGHRYVYSSNDDPIAAIVGALEAMPKAPKRAPKVTATVTDDPPEGALPNVLNDGLDNWLPKP